VLGNIWGDQISLRLKLSFFVLRGYLLILLGAIKVYIFLLFVMMKWLD
jgi:hypothetical protein